ncbi:endonuclease/exonuclease/phosphatase family protein [Rubellimicrobium aerolatum]|uniref:Endonuclease/exonuclease/phosphatase family protein n=1 Tax=Rubellimicrobium aerolatum TaxID=490979 RepID=A0ABW0S7W2_9RHOB|nr:endonuclease/exonuclease/phosphatase family protein [Rubellimicrobium aerolatum]MBP1804441.1 endonuclease/exonuclease/phosphatase (EEP) superfamily protein YafD [Rubellimicrobium aerolatum]
MTVLLLLLALLLAAVTLLPLSGRQDWWIRMWDFPRIQIAIAQGAVAALALWALDGWLRWLVLVPTLLGMAVHLRRIRPFTPLARRQMRFAPRRDDGAEVTLMAANVLMENDRHDLVRDLIADVDPDVLLLMETDERWLEALRPALARYPHRVEIPKDDYYGMIFATKLEVVESEAARLTVDETPSVFAELRTRGGRLFRFVGLHPQPPVPGVDTDERDAQILYAARFARKSDVPLVTMGDFNDAAWSPTSRLFKHYGRYLDPRIGRGLYASFHANNILIRCAIDQLFVTDDIAMVDFRLGPKVGSDHFPVIARVRIDPEEARALNVRPPPMTEEEREEIDERVEEYKRGLSPLDPRPEPEATTV